METDKKEITLTPEEQYENFKEFVAEAAPHFNAIVAMANQYIENNKLVSIYLNGEGYVSITPFNNIGLEAIKNEKKESYEVKWTRKTNVEVKENI